MFSHDGVKDSLTHLAAPPFLYAELRREVAHCDRNGTALCLLRIELALTERKEASIVEFAHALTISSRSEDICARIGEYEFVVVLRGDSAASEIFLKRIVDQWHLTTHPGDLSISWVMAQAGENPLTLLNRLDCEPVIHR